MGIPKWLEWGQRIQALAQSGLTYTSNPFDRERFEALKEIASEILSTYSQVDEKIVRNLIDSEAGYTTPKVDIRGVVFKGDQILLVRERADGGWTLPGGWVDVDESPSKAVEREVWEESGYEVKAERLLALYDRNKHGHPPYIYHVYKIYIGCKLVGGKPVNSIETDDVDFFEEASVPQLSIARTTPEVLKHMFNLHRHPELLAEFD